VVRYRQLASMPLSNIRTLAVQTALVSDPCKQFPRLQQLQVVSLVMGGPNTEWQLWPLTHLAACRVRRMLDDRCFALVQPPALPAGASHTSTAHITLQGIHTCNSAEISMHTAEFH
jgi:hypothetical protein